MTLSLNGCALHGPPPRMTGFELHACGTYRMSFFSDCSVSGYCPPRAGTPNRPRLHRQGSIQMTTLTDDIITFLGVCSEQRGLSDNSLKGYRQDLEAFVRYREGRAELDSSQHVVLDYLRHLRDVKRHKPATVRRRIVTLRKFFDWRSARGDDPSPFLGLELDLRIPKRLPRPVDRPTLKLVLHHARPFAAAPARGWRDVDDRRPSLQQTTGLATRVLLATGLRIGELTNLRLRDVTGAGSRLSVVGKGDRERVVYLTNERLLADFGAYWRWRRTQLVVTDRLFLNARGGRLSEAAFRKRLRTMSRDLELTEHLTPHRFRHSAATLLIEQGVDMRIVQRLLGHASIATTEIYTEVSDTSLVAAIERADVLGSVDAQ